VHLMCAQFTAQVAAAEQGEPVWVDDFWTGSLAAIAGGIRRRIWMPRPLSRSCPSWSP
jgi:hypothetical protein